MLHDISSEVHSLVKPPQEVSQNEVTVEPITEFYFTLLLNNRTRSAAVITSYLQGTIAHIASAISDTTPGVQAQ
jgi:hypothetical protein